MRGLAPIALAANALIVIVLALGASPAEAQVIPARARRALSRASVRCEDAAHCPLAVGMVATLWEHLDYTPATDDYVFTYSINRCTGTLVAPDLVLTNRHCLPPEIVQDGESPAGRIVVAFPAIGDTPAETSRVAAIAAISAEPPIPYLHMPDFALLRLRRDTHRPTMSLTATGPTIGASYTVPSITPVGAGSLANEGLLVVSSIVASRGERDQPPFSTWPMLFGLEHGSIRLGHSGSPVVDDNTIVGLLYGVALPADMTGRTVMESAFEQGYALNVACIRLPGVPSREPIPAGCSNYGVEDVLTLRELSVP